MELHKVDVHEHVRGEGAGLWRLKGKLVSVSGQDYVELPHGTLVQRTSDWRESVEAADALAADRVEALARILMEQAARLRGGENAPA